MRILRVCFYLLLIVSVLGLSVYPTHEARAVVGVKFISCTVGGFLSPAISKLINDGLDKLLKKIPGLGRFFGGALGGDVPVNDSSFMSAWSNKTLRADILARCTAREIFDAMSKGIVNNARTAGRSGGPAFIRDWRIFQNESQQRGEGVFGAMLSNAHLCNYFSSDLKTLFGATKPSSEPTNTRTDNLDSYAVRSNCTMPSNFNLASYQTDFAGNGGWDAWSRMLEPQNNFYGSLFQSLDEVSRQRSSAQSADLNQVIANKGFLGKSGSGVNDSCKTWDANHKICLEYQKIKTPGTVIADSVAASIQQELAWITNVQTIGQVISNATEILLNRLTDLSNPNEGDYTNYDAPTIPDLPPGGGDAIQTCIDQCTAGGGDLETCTTDCINSDGGVPIPGQDVLCQFPGPPDSDGNPTTIVMPCADPNRVGPLTCLPSTQTIGYYHSATLTAKGGTGNGTHYSWHVLTRVTGDNPADGQGVTYTPEFTLPGERIIQLGTSTDSTTCSVTIQ